MNRSRKTPLDLKPAGRVLAPNRKGALEVSQHGVSYHESNVARAIKFLDTYDILVFPHPCPHPSTDGDDRTWQRIFTETKAKKIVIYSDVFWEEMYPWIAEVAKTFDVVYGTNQAALEYIKRTLHPEAELFTHPFYWDDTFIASGHRPQNIVWACQWRGWKGIANVFWPALKGLSSSWRTDMFGMGREYYNIRNDQDFNELVTWDGVGGHSPNPAGGRVNIHGTVTPEAILEMYSRCLVTADFTGASKKYHGHYNRTHIEPMGYGCLVVCRSTVVEPYSFIPRDCVLTADSVSEAIEVFERTWKDRAALETVQRRAHSWAQGCNPKSMMKRYLEDWR